MTFHLIKCRLEKPSNENYEYPVKYAQVKYFHNIIDQGFNKIKKLSLEKYCTFLNISFDNLLSFR